MPANSLFLLSLLNKVLVYVDNLYVNKDGLKMQEKDIERFWKKVDKKSKNECWEWSGRISPNGYGQFWFEGSTGTAHRFIYQAINGRLDKGKGHVCHSCDNRKCVNPNHLFYGTAKDNQQDMTNKGRGRMGVKNGAAKLNEMLASEIRKLGEEVLTQQEIANRYGISQQTVSNIFLGKVW